MKAKRKLDIDRNLPARRKENGDFTGKEVFITAGAFNTKILNSREGHEESTEENEVLAVDSGTPQQIF